MTDTITIALNRLVPWKGNVRKTGAAGGIAELAASIAAHGLLQALVVREGKSGKYEIIAGRRRFLALQSLVKQRIIAKDYAVNCTIAKAGVDETELSLVENTVRVAMHPADQFEAFTKLIDGGSSTADVAARFGVPEKLIGQRLRLGRLSPVILDAYRNGEIDLEIAEAFAISEDQVAQERVFHDLPEWSRGAHTVRRALTEGEVRESDKRVRLIGLDTYEAAGGHVRRDLFGDDCFLLDVELLDRLVSERLATVVTEVASEGWRWVETAADLDRRALAGFVRHHPERIALPQAQQDEFDQLSAEYDQLVDSDDDADAERLPTIEQRLDELTAASERWSAETLRLGGAIISLDHDGSVYVERGLVRKEDQPATPPLENEPGVVPADGGSLPPRLVEDLTAQKSAAIAAELMSQPDIALGAVVHCLLLCEFYANSQADSSLKLSCNAVSWRNAMATPGACGGLVAFGRKRDQISNRLPADPAGLLQWCLACPREELLELLAFIAAKSVNAVQRKDDRPDAARLTHATALAMALNLDMAQWFTPTAEGYFNRLTRMQILADIDDAKGSHAPALDKLKKTELAVRAEAIVAGTGWLPGPLRRAADDASDHDPVAIAA